MKGIMLQLSQQLGRPPKRWERKKILDQIRNENLEFPKHLIQIGVPPEAKPSSLNVANMRHLWVFKGEGLHLTLSGHRYEKNKVRNT